MLFLRCPRCSISPFLELRGKKPLVTSGGPGAQVDILKSTTVPHFPELSRPCRLSKVMAPALTQAVRGSHAL